ncbi:hypothetical protein E3A20_08410 [Planctomyces bekefii]|uniref:Uncharacterized protein n=1 Tax=Planctomyces bekefii TaxID=1653850 RepID=A0A5C6M7G2_9PLAN|nr:hypothetical protein E3A20_08410 [Planctomyces bekefii]
MRTKTSSKDALKKRAKVLRHKYEKDVDGPEYGYLREMLGRKRDVAIVAVGRQRLAGADPISEPDDVGADGKRRKNSSRRFKRYWASLTNAQKAALRMVPDKLTKADVARKLGIRVDTLQERIDHAIKKLLKHFPEFDADNSTD